MSANSFSCSDNRDIWVEIIILRVYFLLEMKQFSFPQPSLLTYDSEMDIAFSSVQNYSLVVKFEDDLCILC